MTPAAAKPENKVFVWAGVAVIVVLLLANFWLSLYVEEIDHDEATFALMARALTQGALPYTELFDNKPPLIFFMLAGSMELFGDNLFAIRFVGWVSIAITAILIFATVQRRVSGEAAVMATLLFTSVAAIPIVRFSAAAWPVCAAMTAITYFLFFYRNRLAALGFVGFLVSIATLTRSNISVVAVVLGAVILFGEIRRAHSGLPKGATLAYVFGGLVPLGIVVGVYALDGSLSMFWYGAVKVALAYASDNSLIEGARLPLSALVGVILQNPLSIGTLVGLGLFWAVFLRKAQSDSAWGDGTILTVMSISVLASIAIAGRPFFHYWIQMFGLLAIMSGYAFQHILGSGVVSRFRAGVALGLSAVAAQLLWSMTPIGAAPGVQKWLVFPIQDAARAIASDREQGDRVWAMKRHLVHWYLDDDPISPLATHPENLIHDWFVEPLEGIGFVAEDALAAIIASPPKYLVMSEFGVPPEFAEIDAVQTMISDRFEPFYSKARVTVLRRREN